MEDDERPTRAILASRAAAEEETQLEHRLGPGTDVGGYLIDGEIGKGGMGVVYGATHPVIGKRAAIKVLRPEVSSQPIVVERFIQEARAVNRIGHPNIIDIFAFGQLPDGRAYHIMDLLVGESLRKRLKRGPLHPSEAASVIEETASALSAAHDKGFVHRDLKPDNVFLVAMENRWPEVKLLDFGLAKLMPEGGMAPFQTKAGVMLGTPEYMSPEQAAGKSVDYRTDIYALGVLMYEILAGQRPFTSLGDPFSTLQQHAEEIPPSIRVAAPMLPEEMVQLVDTMLAKDPDGRPSLAAVRTVIKRLRSTALPTHTQAGLEISLTSSNKLAPVLARDSGLDVRASRLGAEAVLPGDSRHAVRPSLSPGTVPEIRRGTPRTGQASAPGPAASQPGASAQRGHPAGPGGGGGASHPGASPGGGAGASHPAGPGGGGGASHPAGPGGGGGASHPAGPGGGGGASHPGASPGGGAGASHPAGGGGGASHPGAILGGDAGASHPGTSPAGQGASHPALSSQRNHPPSQPPVQPAQPRPTPFQPGAGSHHGPNHPGAPRRSHPPQAGSALAAGGPQHAGTTLGVAPPPRPVTAAKRAPGPARTSRLWLVLGALLAIAAGIALALVLVGTT